MTELTAVLAGTCSTSTPEDQCVDVMDWMAGQMVLDGVCRQDLADKNSIALEALYGRFISRLRFLHSTPYLTDTLLCISGLRSYGIMRKAGCLVNPRTNAYCK